MMCNYVAKALINDAKETLLQIVFRSPESYGEKSEYSYRGIRKITIY